LRKQQVAIKWSAIELSGMDRHPPIVKSLVWPDELATQLFANRLAAQPALSHAYIALHGDLGAGKTTLVRHLLYALGVQGRIKSPTYAVVEAYELAQLNVWHFDFYRFSDPREWEDAGFRDIFASPGLKLAEWPEKAQAMLPTADVDIHLMTAADATRQVTLTANTATGVVIVAGGTTGNALGAVV
jgi:tRNA threonylcarbamoyladenosine biosynthesis protein TsaE